MEIQAAILCDSATVREGLLHVLGGGINRLYRSELPAPLGVALALLVSFEPEEVDQLHEVHMIVRSPNQRLAEAMGALQAKLPSKMEPGENVVLPLVMPLHNVGTTEFGRHVVQLSIDGGVAMNELHFWVLHPDELALPRPW